MSRKFKFEEVVELFTKEGYKALFTEYKDSGAKLKLLCPNGHEIEMNVDGFKAGDRCKNVQSKIRDIHMNMLKILLNPLDIYYFQILTVECRIN